MGVPYQDYIPFFPQVQDPTTGEWRNAHPEEIPGPSSTSGDAAALHEGGAKNPMMSNLFDLSAEGPTLDPNLFDPNSPGPTLDPRLLLDPASPGPSLDPALLDPIAPGPTLDPNLLDPNAPGPTVDPALLDASAPGPTIDPALLDPSAPGPTIDPAVLDHGIVESKGFTEPAGVMDHGFTDPSHGELPPPEAHTPDHDLEDHHAGHV